MVRHYAILINSLSRQTPLEQVKRVVDTAKDWAKLHPDIWLIATEQTADYWYEQIKPVLHPDDQILVVAVDISDRRGWAAPTTIEWFNRSHEGRIGV